MKVSELIDLLNEEIKENPAFADAEVLATGEESGDLKPVNGYITVQAKTLGVYLATAEADTSEFGEGTDEDA